MRSEQEMLDLIIGTARQDDRIRAVIISGSRTNPDAPKDCFQDFDIVYVVTELIPYVHNLEWINRFGELMILQLPDEMADPAPEKTFGYCYLMQFMDGNRIDLTIYPLDKIDKMDWEGFNGVLLDKDGYVSSLIPPGEKVSIPKPPTAEVFVDCTNEFWWLAPYVAKGLWRGEIPYARTMLDDHMRTQLMNMLSWYVGVRTEFTGDPGKLGKYLKNYLPEDWWQLLLNTYADARIDHTWEALFAMARLFRATAKVVADKFLFIYPESDDQRVCSHLDHVRSLPEDAKEIY
jgi:aminoglycoside 6-adenylyltransferase